MDGADAPAVSSGKRARTRVARSAPPVNQSVRPSSGARMAAPRTQRYAAGLATFSTATGTISLRADALPTDLPIAVENHNKATTVRWVRGPSGPLPPKAARNTRREAATAGCNGTTAACNGTTVGRATVRPWGVDGADAPAVSSGKRARRPAHPAIRRRPGDALYCNRDDLAAGRCAPHRPAKLLQRTTARQRPCAGCADLLVRCRRRRPETRAAKRRPRDARIRRRRPENAPAEGRHLTSLSARYA